MPSLDALQVGQRAAIDAVQGNDAIVQRLLEMGLLEGEVIEVIGIAPLGDPIEIRLRDYRLSLRRSEATRITVSLTEPVGKWESEKVRE
jgi:ferrous iron transport protein A